MFGQGFLPRFLLARPKSTIGFRAYKRPDPTEDPRVTGYWTRIGSILNTPISRTDDDGCDVRAITLDADAYEAFVQVYDRWEKLIRPGSDLVDIAAFVSKAAENTARLAGVFALVENINAESISLDAIVGAARLIDKYYLPESLRFVGSGCGLCLDAVCRCGGVVHVGR